MIRTTETILSEIADPEAIRDCLCGAMAQALGYGRDRPLEVGLRKADHPSYTLLKQSGLN